MRIRRALFALGPPLAAGLAAASVPHWRARVSDLAGAAVWGLALLISFVGWGSVLLHVLRLGRSFGWGVRAALGMAGVLAVGGALQVGYWMSPASAMVILGAGLAGLGWLRWSRRDALVEEATRWASEIRTAPWFSLLIGALYCAAAFRFLGSLATPVANPWDDLEAYFAFPKALLADGALHEPFSVRRLINLGGQPFLQSLLLSGSSIVRLNGFDSGLCFLSIFGMADGYAPRARAARVLALTFVLGFVYEVHNVNSGLSGTVLFLALFCVIDAKALDLKRPSVQALLGLLSAAAWTMRQNYSVTACAILAATYALCAWRGTLRPAEAALGLACSLGAALVALIPWWVVAQRSGGTFAYPLILGNGRADFGLTSGISAREEFGFFVFNALWNRPLRSIWLFVLAGTYLARTSKNLSLHALMLGAGFGGFALIHACRGWDDVASMSRYYMAFELAVVLAVLLKCSVSIETEGTQAASVRAKLALALALFAVGIQLLSSTGEVLAQYATWRQLIAAQLPKAATADADDAVYRRLQQAIPAGAPFLEILDQPYRLDFRRNTILICDMPGGSSPSPGLPIYGGVEGYERYFASHSIRYLAYTLGRASPEYKPSLWLQRLRKLDPKVRTGHTLSTLFRHMAVIYLDIFDNLERLEKRHLTVFSEGQIRVLDLASPAPPH